MMHYTPDIAAGQAEMPVWVTRHCTNINIALRKHRARRIMEEDIDDLLEEVETKFIKGPCSRPNSVCKQNTIVENHSYSSLLTQASFRLETCDLDDILKDVDEEKSSLLNSRAVTLGHPGSSGGSKCFPVYLGGAGYGAGHSTLSSPSLKVGMRMLVSVRITPQKTWRNSTIYTSLGGYEVGCSSVLCGYVFSYPFGSFGVFAAMERATKECLSQCIQHKKQLSATIKSIFRVSSSACLVRGKIGGNKASTSKQSKCSEYSDVSSSFGAFGLFCSFKIKRFGEVVSSEQVTQFDIANIATKKLEKESLDVWCDMI
uniref:Uncharacterized protein n=1 Tax=Timema poppense TaxID=170557 RepID=A0A7R9CPI1_TIMPO|nr:unnamed protein product [Timema poppensis]